MVEPRTGLTLSPRGQSRGDVGMKFTQSRGDSRGDQNPPEEPPGEIILPMTGGLGRNPPGDPATRIPMGPTLKSPREVPLTPGDPGEIVYAFFLNNNNSLEV